MITGIYTPVIEDPEFDYTFKAVTDLKQSLRDRLSSHKITLLCSNVTVMSIVS